MVIKCQRDLNPEGTILRAHFVRSAGCVYYDVNWGPPPFVLHIKLGRSDGILKCCIKQFETLIVATIINRNHVQRSVYGVLKGRCWD